MVAVLHRMLCRGIGEGVSLMVDFAFHKCIHFIAFLGEREREREKITILFSRSDGSASFYQFIAFWGGPVNELGSNLTQSIF